MRWLSSTLVGLFIVSSFLGFNADAKVTYDGTGGVFANVFTNNDVQNCTACHSDSWTREDQSSLGRFDVYTNGSTGAFDKAATINTYVKFDLMPYATTSAAGTVTALSQTKKDLLQAWIDGSAPQNAVPEVSATSASSITKTSATIAGTVDPNGDQLNYYIFKMGTTSGSLSTVFTSNTSQENAVGSGGGDVDVAVSASVSSLTCGTTYYYALVADNDVGSEVTSSEANFTTSACNSGPSISTTSLSNATEDTLYQTTISASDPEGDDFTYSLSGEPSGMTINTNSGLLDWTPNNSQSGQTHNFSVIVTHDGSADINTSDTQALSLTVTAVNDAPVITSTAGTSATEDVEYSYSLTVTDDDDSSFTYRLTSEPAGMSIDADGTITWTPINGVTTSGTFSVSVEDDDPSDEKSDTEVITISVTAVNDTPEITSSAVTSATEDAAYSYDVDATDEEGVSITYSLTTKPTGMSIDSSSGVISWTPTVSQLGANSVTVSASDGNSADTQSFSITVSETNDTPVIGSSAVISATEAVAYSYDVDATDEEDDSITYALTQKPTGMTIDSGTGVINWTPPEDSSSFTEDVTVTASDGNSADSQSFTINVTADNDTPVVSSSAVTSGTESVAYSYDVDASDNENDSLTFSLTTKPNGMSIDENTGVISWTPDEDSSNYSENVVVSVSDGNTAGTQSFSINVSADNDSPVISTSAVTSATESAAYSYDVDANDNENDSLTFSLTTKPSGMTIDENTGVISWTPDEDSSSYSESVVVSVSDGNTADTQSFSINVSADNDTPVITSTAATSASESVAYSYDVNASDNENDSLTFSLTTKPTGMSIDSNSGVISWTPDEDSANYSESVVVSVSDGNTADSQSFSITVTANNDTPTITTSAVTSGQENVVYSYDVDASDNENDSLTFSLTTKPSGMNINASTGEISWTPDAALSAYTEDVAVQVSDSNTSSTQSFTVNVAVINDAPAITSSAVTTATEDIQYQYQLVVSDPDDNNNGSDLSFVLSNEPSGMTVSNTGLISWTPTEGDGDANSITVTVADGGEDGASSTQQTFSISVTAVNDAPEITSSAVLSGTESVIYTYQLQVSDAENDSLNYSFTTSPAGMTVSNSGLIEWTPPEASSGFNQDVVVVVSDGNLTDSQNFTITVSADNDAPSFTSSAVTSATEGILYSYSLTASDNENDSLTFSLTSGHADMSVTGSTLTWIPPQDVDNYSQAVVLAVSDGNLSDSQSFTVNVSADNDAPVFDAITAQSASESSLFSFSVNAVDPESESLTYSLNTSVGDMAINSASGEITWTPDEASSDFSQNVSVAVSDDTNTTNTSFTINVSADNDSPVVISSPITNTVESAPYQYDVDASDNENDTLAFSLAQSPAGMSINTSSGLIQWTPPDADNDYEETISVNIFDGVNTTVHSFDIEVSADADTPLITSGAIITAEESVLYSYTPTTFDGQGDTLTFSLLESPTGMTIDSATGEVNWTPPQAKADFSAEVEIQVSDGSFSSEQSYSITVSADDDSPEVTSAAVTSVVENQSYSYDVDATDAENDTLAYSLSVAPTSMTIDSSTGEISWTATAAREAYSDNVTVQVSDGNSSTSHAFVIAVTVVNDAPSITSSPVTTATEELAYQYQVTISDPDDDNNGEDISFSLTNAPSGMSVNSTGLIEWTPSEGQTDANNIVLTAADGGENGVAAASQTFSIAVTTVNDTPSITSSAITTATESVTYSYQVVVSDPENDTISYSLTAAPTDMVVSASGLITWTPEQQTSDYQESVTVVISDGEFEVEQSFDIDVTADNDKPEITSTALTSATENTLYSYQVIATEPEQETLFYSLTEKPDGMTIDENGLIAWSVVGSVLGFSEPVSVNVTDGFNTVVQSYMLTVTVANESPEITSSAVLEATEDEVYQYQLTVTDPDDNNNGTDLTFTLNQAPEGMTVSNTGLIEWTPSNEQTGEQQVAVTVADGGEDNSLPAQQSYTITVTAVNDAPEITSTPAESAVQFSAYSYQLEVNDPDDLTNELTFSLLTAPEGMEISATGLITWTPDLGQQGLNDVTVSVADGGEDNADAAEQSFAINVSDVNLPPEITSTAPTEATEDVEYQYQVLVEDPNDDNNGTDISFSLDNAPEGMTVSNTGLISWTPVEGQLNADDVVISAADGGESDVAPASETFSIVVTPVNDSPVITSTPPESAVEAQQFSYQIEVADPDDENDGEALTFSVESELGEALILTNTGLLTWTPVEGQLTSGEIIVTVNDGGEDSSQAASQSFTLSVTAVNQGPELAAVTELTAVEDQLYSYQLEVTDPDDSNNGDDLNFELINAPDGMAVSNTGLITWTPENGVLSSELVTVSVSDGGEDNTEPASVEFAITVTPVNDAPVITSTAITTATEDEAYLYQVEFSDIDSDDLTINLLNAPDSMTLVDGLISWTPVEGETSANVVLQVTDGELEALQSFTITVTAVNDAPEFNSEPSTSATEDQLYTYKPDLIDAENQELTLTLLSGPSGMVLEQGELSWTPTEGQLETSVVLTVSDGELSALQSFDLVVTPVNDAPELSELADATITELASFSSQVIVSDIDSTQVSLSLTGEPAGMTISDTGFITYQATELSAGQYSISVLADDGGDENNTATTDFVLTVLLLDEDLDLVADYADNCVGLANPQQLDLDQDNLGNDCDLDDDGDGISDELELTYNLNPLDANDALLDLDGDGDNNLQEVQACLANNDQICRSIELDSVPPVISVSEPVFTTAATGFVTQVNMSASAFDLVDGDVIATLDDTGPYRPGTHNLIWSARDAENNIATASQVLHVLPLVTLSGSQVVGEEQSVSVEVQLNGIAPEYPIVIDYQVSGSADAADMTLLSGSIEIQQGTSGLITFAVLADDVIEGDETVEVTLTQVTGSAQLGGGEQQQLVTIVDRNVAPELEITVNQGDIQALTVYRDQGVVTVTAEVFDANNDELSLSFQPAVELPEQNIENNLLTFAPETLAETSVDLLVEVSDGQSTTSNQIQLLIFNALPQLSDDTDSDNDGISDAEEGITDSDGDRVPDFLDSIDDPSLLATTAGDTESLMQTSDGLRLALGDTAAASQTGDAQLSQDEVVNEQGEVVEDDQFDIVGAVFDFEVSGLNDLIRVAQVVIPLSQAIPENAVYRKFDGVQWLDFVEDADNAIASARRVDGQCPTADSDLYQSGLAAFDDCIRLTLSDGGPNDADGEVNGVIKDPGGIAVATVDLEVSFDVAERQVPTEQPQGSSGSMTWFNFMLFSLLVLTRYKTLTKEKTEK